MRWSVLVPEVGGRGKIVSRKSNDMVFMTQLASKRWLCLFRVISQNSATFRFSTLVLILISEHFLIVRAGAVYGKCGSAES